MLSKQILKLVYKVFFFRTPIDQLQALIIKILIIRHEKFIAIKCLVFNDEHDNTTNRLTIRSPCTRCYTYKLVSVAFTHLNNQIPVRKPSQ